MDTERFIDDMFPSFDDLDIVGYKIIAAGLVFKYGERLRSQDPKVQRSFRNVLLNAFEPYTGGRRM